MRIRHLLAFALALCLSGAVAQAANWTCYATGENFSTGSTNNNAKTQTEVLAYGGATSGTTRMNCGAFKFNVTAVPATTVTSIEFHFYVNAANWPYWSVTPVTNNPVLALPSPLWTDIFTEATSGYYNFQNEGSTYGAGWKTLLLGGAAEANLTAIVNGSQEWFALGAIDRDTGAPAYYLEIDGYAMANPPYIIVYSDPPPANDTCAGAIVVPGTVGVHSYTGNTQYANNDYNASGPCVGSLPHPGNDVAYVVTVPGGCEVCATLYQSTMTWNGGVYLVGDCADINGTCVAGASGWLAGGLDETFCYEPTGTATYYIIVDGRTATDFGAFNLDVFINCINGPTNLTCTGSTADVDLAWTNNEAYSQIRVYADGALVATLPGTATTYSYVPPAKGYWCFYVEAFKADGSHKVSNTCCLIWGAYAVTVEDFQADNGGYVVQGTGSWEWGALTAGPCITGVDGNVWATVLGGNYANGACWLLDSVDIDLTDKGGLICFDHCYDIEAGYDGANVWFTTDDFWYYLFDPANRPYPAVNNGVITTCPWIDLRPVFSGTSGAWVTDCWDLTDPMWAGQAVTVRFAFGSDPSVAYTGWAIDNVTVYTNAGGTVSCAYVITPLSGTVPFNTNHQLQMGNLYTGYLRRVAGRIDVRVANNQFYSNWRSGYTNLAPLATFTTSFPVTIPALSAVIGQNKFMFLVQDVTPSPYNQPPYPMSGDTCSVTNTVVAHAP